MNFSPCNEPSRGPAFRLHNPDHQTHGRELLSSPNSTGVSSSTGDHEWFPISQVYPQNPILHPQPGTEFWLWERSIIRVGRVQTKLPGHGEEIDNMLAFYDDVMKPVWCENWLDIESFPQSDKAHQQIRKELHDQLSAFFLQGPERKAKSNKTPEDPSLSAISLQLSPLFQTIAIVKHWQRQEADGTLSNGINFHLAWKLLLTSYCRNLEDELPFEVVAQEKIMHYAPTSRCIERSTFPAEAFCRLQLKLSASQSKAVQAGIPRVIASLLDVKASQITEYVRKDARRPRAQRFKRPMTGTAHACFVFTMNRNRPVGNIQTAFSQPSGRADEGFSNERPSAYNPSIFPARAEASHTLPSNHPSARGRTTLLPSATPKFGISLAFYFADLNHKQSKVVLKAFHHAQMYCITLLNFLCELGISEFPVFALVTTGFRGSILMAWHSKKTFECTVGSEQKALTGCNVLVDYNLASFDLTNPLEVYFFVLAICRIHLHYGKLQKLLTAKDLHRLPQDPKFTNWIIIDEV